MMTCGGKDTIVQSVGAYAPVDRRKAGGGDPFAAPHEAGIGTKRRKPRRRVYVSFWESSGSAWTDGRRVRGE
jgi:hypothetical protein